MTLVSSQFFFFFNDPATTEIYTLSLHDALPISTPCSFKRTPPPAPQVPAGITWTGCCIVGAPGGGIDHSTLACRFIDRKSTRLNSSHANISYAVFCLKKKKQIL